MAFMHHQGIRRILPLGDAAQHQAFGQVGGQILEAVDGNIRLVHQHLGFQFLGEKPLVANFGQRHIQNFVALGGHGLDTDPQFRMGLQECLTHPVGLHHGQLAAAGGDAQGGAGHQRAEGQADLPSGLTSLGIGGIAGQPLRHEEVQG